MITLTNELNAKEKIRSKILDLNHKKILLARINELEESNDACCYCDKNGFYRIRKYKNFSLFLCNSISKQQKRLLRGLDETTKEYQTLVFQNVGCNWRCWYCFVDDDILSANSNHCIWVSPDEMVDVLEKSNIDILDLSGGQPDLVPEWCLWIMKEIERRGLRGKKFIWMDDNLGCIDVLEKHLSKEQIRYMAEFPKHSRAVCFKGYDDISVQFNICNKKVTLTEQLSAFERLYNYGFDLYGYVTLTTPTLYEAKNKIKEFIIRLQKINYNIPLRIIPLEIKNFSVTQTRLKKIYNEALSNQFHVYKIWEEVMSEYYTDIQRRQTYESIKVQ